MTNLYEIYVITPKISKRRILELEIAQYFESLYRLR